MRNWAAPRRCTPRGRHTRRGARPLSPSVTRRPRQWGASGRPRAVVDALTCTWERSGKRERRHRGVIHSGALPTPRHVYSQNGHLASLNAPLQPPLVYSVPILSGIVPKMMRGRQAGRQNGPAEGRERAVSKANVGGEGTRGLAHLNCHQSLKKRLLRPSDRSGSLTRRAPAKG